VQVRPGEEAISAYAGLGMSAKRFLHKAVPGRWGESPDATLAAAGYIFRLLIRWLAELLCAVLRILVFNLAGGWSPYSAPLVFFTDESNMRGTKDLGF
jgi:hypothetical protein